MLSREITPGRRADYLILKLLCQNISEWVTSQASLLLKQKKRKLLIIKSKLKLFPLMGREKTWILMQQPSCWHISGIYSSHATDLTTQLMGHHALHTTSMPLLCALPQIYSMNYLKHPPKSPFRTWIPQHHVNGWTVKMTSTRESFFKLRKD